MGWRLNVPAGYSESGKREQRFFNTRQKALDAAQRYKEKRAKFGTQAKSIKPILAEAATRAEAILKPYGITILEAAERVAEMERLARASKPITEAFSAFMEEKEGKRSLSTLRDYRYLGETLTQAFGDRMLAEIKGEEIVEAIKAVTGTASTFNRRIDNAGRFLKWAARKPRQWADASEIENFENKEHKKGKVTVMTPQEVETLLRAAEEHYPDTVPAFVLMTMMGVRPSEISKMAATDITEDGVTVPDEDEDTGEATKTGRRFIHMTPIVAEWLKCYPMQDRVAPPNWDRKWDAVRRLAGWSVVSEFLKGTEWETTDGLPAWKQDVLRHTAATVTINMGKPLSVLIFEHGHTQGETTLKKHYLGKMTKKQAVTILAIGPHGKKLKTINAA